jgi:hypothetical protein
VVTLVKIVIHLSYFDMISAIPVETLKFICEYIAEIIIYKDGLLSKEGEDDKGKF